MLKIGDRIRDVEDGDCYFEGVVVSLNPIQYKIDRILWDGEEDNSMNGKIIGLTWWEIEKVC